MKKIKILAMTSAAVMAVTALAPMSAYGAVHTYRLPGKGMAVVVGSGSSLGDILGQLQKPGIGDCLPQLPGLPGQPGADQPEFPDTNWPGQPDTDQPGQPDTDQPGQPDINWPELPDINQPEQPDTNWPGLPNPELPEQPDTDQPDSNQPGQPDSNQPNQPDSNQPNQPDTSYTAQVLTLVNAQRAQAGLSPLRLDTRVAQAAQVRAEEIQTSFSHTRPDGSHFSTALKEAGVSYRSCGENIAWGQKTPQQVMEGWMNSSGHRANILNPEYTAIGIGYAQNSAGTGYWTQLFIR